MTPAAFEPKLRDYVLRLTFKAWVYTFDERVQAAAATPARVLSAAEADAWLGDLQLRIGRTSDAAKRIEGAAAAEPDNAAAALALGRLRVFQHRLPDAWPALEQAARLAPDDFAIQYGAAVAMLQYLDEAVEEKRARLEQRAHDALAQAARLTPNSPDTLAWLAYAAMRQRAWDEAANAIATAMLLAPGRAEFRLRQADIMILRGAPNVARPMLQDIIARSGDKVSADNARRRLEALDAAMLPRTHGAAAATLAAVAPPGLPQGVILDLRPADGRRMQQRRHPFSRRGERARCDHGGGAVCRR